MEDITKSMLKFKEACRHTWNTCFYEASSTMSPDIQKAFSAIEESFFYVLILRPLSIPECTGKYRKNAWPWLSIKLKEGLGCAPVNFGQIGNKGGVKFEESVLTGNEVLEKFKFFDFFDWYSYNFIDLSLVRARDLTSEKVMLIEERYCRFFYNSALN